MYNITIVSHEEILRFTFVNLELEYLIIYFYVVLTVLIFCNCQIHFIKSSENACISFHFVSITAISVRKLFLEGLNFCE